MWFIVLPSALSELRLKIDVAALLDSGDLNPSRFVREVLTSLPLVLVVGSTLNAE